MSRVFALFAVSVVLFVNHDRLARLAVDSHQTISTLSAAAAQTEAAATFVTFAVPSGVETYPTSINLYGDVTGFYTDAADRTYGFVRTSNGAITTFDIASARDIRPDTIDAAGTIVGNFWDTSGYSHGFVRLATGAVTVYNINGAFHTSLTGISSSGTLIGIHDAGGTGVLHGFSAPPAGKVLTFDAPGAMVTYPDSINDTGVIAGRYGDQTGAYHGFVRSGGVLTAFDVPGSAGTTLGTLAWSINNAGTVTGYAEVVPAKPYEPDVRSFIRTSDGTITTFNVPLRRTHALSINSSGQVTGYYRDYSGYYHGFLRQTDGTITTFDVTRTAVFTTPAAINDAGLITGYYRDRNGATRGFIRFP